MEQAVQFATGLASDATVPRRARRIDACDEAPSWACAEWRDELRAVEVIDFDDFVSGGAVGVLGVVRDHW